MTEPAKPKGHWPKGKHRNADAGEWGKTRVALTALLDHHFEPGVISAAALAEVLNVYTKTVTRWLKGDSRPPPETQEMVATWIAQQRERIAQRKRTHRA